MNKTRKEKIQIKLPKRLIEYLFYFISTVFIVSMIRTSILIPQLFSSTNAYKFDYTNSISDPNQRQLALIISDLGLGNKFFITSIVSFISIWIYVIVSPYGKKLKVIIPQIFAATATASGILVTIFSIWRVS